MCLCLAGKISKWSGTGKKYVSFISHFKAEGGDTAALLKKYLGDELPAPLEVFLDSDNLHSLHVLMDAVKQSDTVIVLQTEKLLTRPWCQAQALLADLPRQLELLNPGAGEVGNVGCM